LVKENLKQYVITKKDILLLKSEYDLNTPVTLIKNKTTFQFYELQREILNENFTRKCLSLFSNIQLIVFVISPYELYQSQDLLLDTLEDFQQIISNIFLKEISIAVLYNQADLFYKFLNEKFNYDKYKVLDFNQKYFSFLKKQLDERSKYKKVFHLRDINSLDPVSFENALSEILNYSMNE
jgi:hypothetical protein